MTQPKLLPNNNILGPITADDWDDLINYRSAIKFMEAQTDANYKPVVAKYKAAYNELWAKYFKLANDNIKAVECAA